MGALKKCQLSESSQSNKRSQSSSRCSSQAGGVLHGPKNGVVASQSSWMCSLTQGGSGEGRNSHETVLPQCLETAHLQLKQRSKFRKCSLHAQQGIFFGSQGKIMSVLLSELASPQPTNLHSNHQRSLLRQLLWSIGGIPPDQRRKKRMQDC